MGQKQQLAAGSSPDPKKRRRVGFSPIDAGVAANECIEIYLVSSKEEVGSTDINSIDPVDLNSFFDDDGKIYGYKDLKITVWINSASLHSYAEITYESMSDGGKGITDLKSSLQKIFAETLVDDKDEFLKTFSTEKHFLRNIVSTGEVLQQKSIDGNSSHSNDSSEVSTSDLKAVRMNIDNGNAGLLYSRLVPLALLLIDGSSPIDVTDSGWDLYLLIHKKKDQEEDPLFQLIGFSAVYRFYRYPEGSRLRLSQILVLPPYQRHGYGSCLVKILNNVAVSENIFDLTIEEPSESLQHVRTCIDIQRLLAFEPIKPAIDSAVQILKNGKLSKKAQMPRFVPPSYAVDKVRETLKINRKQFVKCWEILIYLGLDPIEKYMEDYTMMITDHVRTDVLGKDSETSGKRMIEVESSFEPDSSFVVFKSRDGDAGVVEKDRDVKMEENVKEQEEQLRLLVEERMKEIKLVADKVSKTPNQ